MNACEKLSVIYAFAGIKSGGISERRSVFCYIKPQEYYIGRNR